MLLNSKYANRIDYTESSTFFTRLFEIGLFVMLVGYFIFHGSRVPMVICTAFGIVTSIIFTLNKAKYSRFKIPVCGIWYFLFFIFSEVSSFWAADPATSSRYYLVIMILIMIISFLIPQYTDTVDQAEKLFKVYIFSILFISVIQLIFTPVSEWTSGFFGMKVGGNNSNSFGYINMIAAIISFYLGYIKNQKRYYLAVIAFIFFSFLTSSRKAIAMCIFGIIFIVLFAFKKRHHILHLIALCIAAVIGLLMLLEIDILYDIAGFRFEGLLKYYLYDDQASGRGSLSQREYFIEFAQLLFQEKPLFGHGFANFALIFGTESDVSWAVYAHNNYWEILADLGIFGFIVYYWFYIFLLIKLVIKLFKDRENTLTILALALLIAEFILEWGVVSMTSFYPILVMILIYICSFVSNSKRKYHYSPTKNPR